MTLLIEFKSVSDCKFNISKTQIMALNFKASTWLENTYKLKWETEAIKYLRMTEWLKIN